MNKKRISTVLTFLLILLFLPLEGQKVKAADGRVESATNWAIQIAADDSHGYSQLSNRRWGNPDYDCATLVITAFKQAGFNVGAATYTGNMRSAFTSAGFKWIPKSQIDLNSSAQLIRGDILLNEANHTEIYIGNNQRVGAHYGYVDIYDRNYPGDNNGTEISIYSYSNSSNWDGILRYEGAAGYNPKGVVDLCSGGSGLIRVAGWAFDADSPGQSTDVHVYIGGAAGAAGAEGHVVTANLIRDDVNKAYGILGKHGYDATIETNKTGTQTVYFYAINIGGGTNQFIGSKTVTISEKKVNPPNITTYFSENVVPGTSMGTPMNRDSVKWRGDYYFCYQLKDPTTGKAFPANNNYSVYLKVTNAKGTTIAETRYNGSPGNWIRFKASDVGKIVGTAVISGAYTGSSSFDITIPDVTRMKPTAWFSSSSGGSEVTQLEQGKSYYVCYKVCQNETKKPLNDIANVDYSAQVVLTSPSGKATKVSAGKKDSFSTAFTAAESGKYSVKVIVSGEVNFSFESSIESKSEKKAASSYYGDVSGDGYVSETDTMMISQYIVGNRTFTSDQKKRADVNGDGKIDTVDITNVINYINGSIKRFPAQPLVLSQISVGQMPDKTLYYVGDSFDKTGMVIYARYDDGSKKQISGYSVNASTAKAGTVTVTVSYTENGVTKTAGFNIVVKEKEKTIEIVKKIVLVTGISLDKKELSMVVGDTAELSAKISPSDAVNQMINWLSSDTGVATVKGGKITALAEGQVMITASSINGKSATCKVTVTAKDQSEPAGGMDGQNDTDITKPIDNTSNADVTKPADDTSNADVTKPVDNTNDADVTKPADDTSDANVTKPVNDNSRDDDMQQPIFSEKNEETTPGYLDAEKKNETVADNEASEEYDEDADGGNDTEKEAEEPLGVGDEIETSTAIYEITALGTDPQVEYVVPMYEDRTEVSIPKTITMNGVTYRVVSIAAGAFDGMTSLKKVVIGSNIEQIGKKSFFGCSSLKSITIKTTKLKASSVGAKAFKKVAKKVTVKVPKSKKKTYKKLLKKAGIGSKAKYKTF